jgi:uncharacterized protein (TIGR02246 family)
MRTLLYVSAVFAVAVGVRCAQPDVQQATLDAERQAVVAAFEGLLAASEAGDADGYVSFVTDDAVMMYSGQPAVVGTEAIRAFISDFFQQYRFEFTSCQSEEIQIAGDWAFHRYSGIAIITAKAGGDPIRLDRKYIDILRKEGASWRVSHHIFNLNE